MAFGVLNKMSINRRLACDIPGIETEHYTGTAKATKHSEWVSSPRHSDLTTSTLHLSVHRQPKVTFRESAELIIYHSYHTQVAIA